MRIQKYLYIAASALSLPIFGINRPQTREQRQNALIEELHNLRHLGQTQIQAIITQNAESIDNLYRFDYLWTQKPEARKVREIECAKINHAAWLEYDHIFYTNGMEEADLVRTINTDEQVMTPNVWTMANTTYVNSITRLTNIKTLNDEYVNNWLHAKLLNQQTFELGQVHTRLYQNPIFG